MINRCILCNGVIRGGKCVDCGMPDRSSSYNLNQNMSRNEKRREYETMMNKSTDTYSSKKTKKKSFQMEIPRDLNEGLRQAEDLFNNMGIDFNNDNKSKQQNYQQTVYQNKTGRNQTNRNTGKTKKPKTIFKVIVTIFLIFQIVLPLFMGVIGAVFNVIGDTISDAGFTSGTTEIEEVLDGSTLDSDLEASWYSYNYDDDIELRALATTGSEVNQILDYGVYEVGVHVPEGTYTMTCLAPGSVRFEDYENERYLTEYLYEESVGVTSSEVNLYNGTIITIGDGSVEFASINGNEESMYGVTNDNVSETKLEGILTVGEDIEPGFYDIVIGKDDFGFVRVSNPYESLPVDEEGVLDTNDYETPYLYGFYLHYGEWDIEDGTVVEYVKNVYLPEGAEIGADTYYSDVTIVGSEVNPPESSLENWLETYR